MSQTEKPMTTIYVDNIASTVDNGYLLSLLQLCGPVKSFSRAPDSTTGALNTFCEFESVEGVLRAVRLLSKLSIDGQELKIYIIGATREDLEGYVEKKKEKLKNLKADEGKNELLKLYVEELHQVKNEDDKNESNNETDNDTCFGLLTNEDKNTDLIASEKLRGMVDERLRNKSLLQKVKHYPESRSHMIPTPSSYFSSNFDYDAFPAPPMFDHDFFIWKWRMSIFLECADGNFPEIIKNGPYIPVVDNFAWSPVPKDKKDWTEDDKKLVNLDTQAKCLIGMALPDDVLSHIMHCSTAKQTWDTLCELCEGTEEVKNIKKAKLNRQYELFVAKKGETLFKTYMRFSRLLNELKHFGVEKENIAVVNKFMDSLPDHWDTLVVCLRTCVDLQKITLSDLYDRFNCYEMSKEHKNAMKDFQITSSSKDERSDESVAEEGDELTELVEELTLLTNKFLKFRRRSNVGRSKTKPMAFTTRT